MKNQNRHKPQPDLPGFMEIEGTTIVIRNGRIPHQEILQSSEGLTRLVEIYRERVLSQKTRTIGLLGKKNPAKILNTLLGYEVQAAYKRIQCPDLVTARYIRLFSELGCRSIQLPYDPTLTAELIPEFEATVDSFARKIHSLFPRDIARRQYVMQRVFAIIRQKLRN
jgi:hypothetical protein